MSIHNKIMVIKRVNAIVTELKQKYTRNAAASPELNKLGESLNQLTEYLSHIDQLQPNYTTNEIDKYVLAINTNLDILKGELDKTDYLKLFKSTKVLKTILKFHPTRYSFFEFIVIWLYEMIYYI